MVFSQANSLVIDDAQPVTYCYRMLGLNVESEIALPGRVTANKFDTFKVDVVIDVADVPERLERVTFQGPNWSVDETRFLLDLPEIGRFMASGGRRLSICPAPGMPVEDIVVFAIGTGLSAILYQRGALLLHGSAVVHDGRAFIFCGPSGAGKSTLAGALCRAGCTLLCDDLCSVEQADDGAPLIESDGRMLRLFGDSIEQLALTQAVGPRVRQQVDKYHVSTDRRDELAERVPIGAIYILGDSNAAQPAGLDELPSLTAAQALLRQSYRRRLALAYSAQGKLAARTAALLSHARVYHLRRPRDFAGLEDTVGSLIAHWARLP